MGTMPSLWHQAQEGDRGKMGGDAVKQSDDVCAYKLKYEIRSSYSSNR